MIKSPSTYTLLLTLIFILTAVNLFFTLPCQDMAWYSLGAAHVLDGETLYRDLFDPAPPLIFWLYALPVAAARAFSWPEVLVIKYFTLASAAAGIIACAHILKRSSLWTDKERRLLILGIAGIVFLLPDNYVTFAQREHLLIVFALPYFLALLPSVPANVFSCPVKILLGAFAALGLCIKPYFFVIWAAALLWKMWREKSLRSLIGPAEITIVLLTLLYLAAIVIFTPQYFDWLRIFAPIYGYYGSPVNTPSSNAVWFLCFAIAAMVAAWGFGLFRLPSDAPYRQDTQFLIAVAIGAYLEMLLQFKTWQYSAYPFEALGLLALFPVILRDQRTNILAIAVIALAFYPVTPLNNTQQDETQAGYSNLMHAIEPYRNAPDLYLINDYVAPPLAYRDTPPLEWKNAFSSINFLLFGIMERSPITGVATHTMRPGQEWRALWLSEAIAGDIEKKHPSLIVIIHKWDDSLSATDQYLDLGQWLSQNKKFALILSHYQLAKKQDVPPDSNGSPRHCQYQVYTYHP